ncbi:glycosyltransferase [Oerskovia flava]|uniref:glycosyltransferase n=1 Tax=Oerskovia flava TaxID=2986422 RepID=UPI00223EEBE1|nr:glycosyltransferase [Oerskovia sp. JB1-3-2]
MTSSDTTSPSRLAAPGAPRPAARADVPDVVASVTGALPVVVTVAAVVVTRGSSPYLAETLAALRAQSVAPDSVTVVDVSTSGASGDHDGLPLGAARFIAAPRARSFGDAVGAGLAGEAPSTWLWLLHDDSAPAPDALAELLRAVEHTSAVAVAGAKQRRWDLSEGPPDSGGVLVSVGYTTSPLGRRMTGIDEDEIDQGQHDAREDVLAVGLAGALVRRSVWDALGGTDPELGAFGDGLDLSRRARLAGHRVVVVPSAVVYHAQASFLGLRERAHAGSSGPDPDPDASYGVRRRSALHARLVAVPGALLPVVVVATLLWAPFQAMYRLVMKRPGQARDELWAPVWALLRPRAVLRARRSVRRTSTLPRRTLRPLRGTWRQVLSERRDRRLARAERRRTYVAPTQIERAELRSLALRRRAVLAALTLALVGLTTLVFGTVAGAVGDGGRFVGGALLVAGGTLGDVWQAATSGWVTNGLGVPAPADPLVTGLLPAVLLVGGSLQTAVNALVVTSLLAAGLGAWFAAGAVTRSVGLRAWAVVVWVAAPPLLLALDGGRLGALVAHATLPWVALGLLRALGVHRVDVVAPAYQPSGDGDLQPVRSRVSRQPGSLGAAAASGLALALAVAGAPVLLPVAVVVVLLLVLGVRRHRRYLVLVLIPSLVAFAPFWVHALRTDDGWRALLAEPGAPLAQVPAAPWQMLLGQPVAPAAWFTDAQPVDGALGDVLGAVLSALPYVLGVAVVLLALAALVGPRPGAPVAWCVAAVGLAAAVLASRTTVSTTGEGAVTAWPGAALSLVLLALGGAALLGARVAEGLLPGPQGRARAALVAGAAALVLALPVGAVTAWALDGLDRGRGTVGDVRVTAEPVVPPVGQQMQGSPRAVRVLSLELDGPVVEYALLRGDGPQLLDSAVAVQVGELTDDGSDQEALPSLVAELTTGAADDVTPRLGDLAVGAVLVPAGEDTQQRAELVARLDMVAGLERVTEGQSGVIWRVAPESLTDGTDTDQPAWARVLAAAPGDAPAGSVTRDVTTVETLPAAGQRVSTSVEAGAAGRVVVLAETAAPGWRATLDGRSLPRVEAGGLQAFELGADGGHLAVQYTEPLRTPWLVTAGVTLMIYVLLAVPAGRRRAGTR